jgi:hypothetical protein
VKAGAVPSDRPLDWQSLDQLVLSIPVHVLYFDGGLICRYAAPAGPHFLGQPASALVGRPASQILPPELALAPRLEQVLTSQQPWHSEQVAYPAGPQAQWPAGSWQVHARPWTLAEARPAAVTPDNGRHHAGVLVSCLPGPTATMTDAAVTHNLVQEGERAAVLLEGIRTQLTVIRGFSGLLQRRGQTDAFADGALRHVDRAARTLTELVQQYETATQAHHSAYQRLAPPSPEQRP